MEIAALHLAEEKAVVHTTRIRKDLGNSEKELSALEREMHEVGMKYYQIHTYRMYSMRMMSPPRPRPRQYSECRRIYF